MEVEPVDLRAGAFAGFGAFFFVKGLGGVFSIRASTSSRVGGLVMQPMPKEVEIRLYHAIGGMVIRYGFIDALIAETCRALFEDLGGHSSQKKAPRPMGVRLEYIGKCFRNKPELAVLTNKAENICATIKQIDFYRTYIVHGCLTEYIPHPHNPGVQLTKLDPKMTVPGTNRPPRRYSYPS